MSQLINLPQYKISQWQSLWVLLTFSNENSTTFDSTSYPLFYTEGKRYSFWYLMSKWIVLFGESLLEIAFHFLSNLQNSYDFTLNTHALRIKVVLVLSLFDSSPVICFGFFKTLFVLVSPKCYGEHTLSIQSTYQGKRRSFVFWEKLKFHKKWSHLFEIN